MPNAPHLGHGGTNVNLPMGTSHNYPSFGSPPMHNGGAPAVVHNHYHAPIGTPQMPAGHPIYNQQPVYGGAPMAQPFVPGQTLVVLPSGQQSSGGRGFGTMLKEALVFSTVNAGVNRLINGPSHSHSYQQSAPAAVPGSTSSSNTVSNTYIYNNGAPVPGQIGQPSVPGGGPTSLPTGATGGLNPSSGSPDISNPGTSYPAPLPSSGYYSPSPSSSSLPSSGIPQASNFSPSNSQSATGNVQPMATQANNQTNNQTEPPVYQYFISNEELWNLTEKLFAKDEFNASQYITLNLQRRSISPNATDEAPGP